MSFDEEATHDCPYCEELVGGHEHRDWNDDGDGIDVAYKCGRCGKKWLQKYMFEKNIEGWDGKWG